MHTHASDVLESTERQQLITMFEAIYAGQEDRLENLRAQRAVMTEKEPDPNDQASRDDEKRKLDSDISNLNDHEMPRICRVINKLRAGWDGSCASCNAVSVLPRLRKGHPTLHCCDCKTKMETAAQHGSQVVDPGVYRPSLAYSTR